MVNAAVMNDELKSRSQNTGLRRKENLLNL
jgi:hypothetical protein